LIDWLIYYLFLTAHEKYFIYIHNENRFRTILIKRWNWDGYLYCVYFIVAVLIFNNKIKHKRYNSVGTIPKSKRKMWKQWRNRYHQHACRPTRSLTFLIWYKQITIVLWPQSSLLSEMIGRASVYITRGTALL
jgi:hypothetical protein